MTSMPDHLSDADLHRFHADGEMTADEKAQLLEHLGRCADCAARHIDLLRAHRDQMEQPRGMALTMSVVGEHTAAPPTAVPGRPERTR